MDVGTDLYGIRPSFPVVSKPLEFGHSLVDLGPGVGDVLHDCVFTGLCGERRAKRSTSIPPHLSKSAFSVLYKHVKAIDLHEVFLDIDVSLSLDRLASTGMVRTSRRAANLHVASVGLRLHFV